MSFLREYAEYFERPAKVQVDLTDICNLDCLYCYNKANQLSVGKTDMSDQEFGSVIGKVIDQLNPVIVTFAGGEPLVRRELLFESMRRLKAHDIKVWLNTNATLVDAATARALAEIGVDQVSVNVESRRPIKHDLIRGKQGALGKTEPNILRLKDALGAGKISITTVITRLNLDQIVGVAELVKEHGFKELHLLDMIPRGAEEDRLIPSREDWLGFAETFKTISAMGIRINPNHAMLYLSEFDNSFNFPFCMAGRLKMVICANGDVVPCNYFKSAEFLCGNALRDDLRAVWSESAMMNKFRYSQDGYESCGGCPSQKKCAGGCKAFSKHFFADAFKPDPYCSVYQLNANRRVSLPQVGAPRAVSEPRK